MSTNQTIESPDFLRIKDEAGQSTMDGVQLLWFVLNEEAAARRRAVRAAQERIEPAVKSAAPTAGVDNYPHNGASVLHFTGSTNFTISGIMAPEPGKARLLLIHNSGSATITIAHESASSISENRIVCSTGANKSVGANASILLCYLNSRWRDITL